MSARAGDRNELENLLKKTTPDLRRFAHQVCRTGADAEDAVQHVLVNVSLRVDGLEGIQRFTSWAFAVIRNECTRALSVATKWLRSTPPEPEAAPDPHRQAESRELLELVVEASRWSPTPGLGNGGLGRLAACFLDSLATLDCPAWATASATSSASSTQEIINGYQVERADEWLKFGNPWEIVRPEHRARCGFYGHVETTEPDGTRFRVRWVPGDGAGVPYDTPIAGYGTHTVNTLRLWQARASNRVRLRPLQRRRLRAQRRRRTLRGHLEGALPERPEPGRQASCA
jgi:hypothetical protein